MDFLVNLDVDDLERATDFYRAVLGLRVGRRFDDWGVELLGGPAPLHLLLKAPGSHAGADSAQRRDYRRHWTPLHLDFVVEDIDTAVQRALAAGARQEGATERQPWGQLALMVDPFGHGFCFVQFSGRGYDEIAEPAATGTATGGAGPGVSGSRAFRILHLEDSPEDAALIQTALAHQGVVADVQIATSRTQFLSALRTERFDIILSDSSVPGFSGQAARQLTREQRPDIPFIFVSGSPAAGRMDHVPKSALDGLASTIERALQMSQIQLQPAADTREADATDRLIDAIQALSLARDLETVMAIVRSAARELTGADGATFVLRERDLCYYADEDAIAPLWKGQRFPMSACISGWVMLNREAAVIEDIYSDPRIPSAAYRPTFVKSLAMVPIRSEDPIGAIGNYWAGRHRASPEQLRLLQTLANSTAIALENVQLYNELEQRVRERTDQLEVANDELEAFAYSVSHDLRAPLRHIDGFSQLLLEKAGALDEEGNDCVTRIRRASQRMGQLIDDLLRLSRIARTEVRRQKVDLSALAQALMADLLTSTPGRQAEIEIEDGLQAEADPWLLRIALENLLSNAWKYSARGPTTRIDVGCAQGAQETPVFYVRDNGVGFDMTYADRLFAPFQRLHPESEFPGVGVGLATVQRIIHKHGGRIWAESSPGEGATFYFSLD